MTDSTVQALLLVQHQIIEEQRQRIAGLQAPPTQFCYNSSCHAKIDKVCIALQSCFTCNKFWCGTCAPSFVVPASFNCEDCGNNSYCYSCFQDDFDRCPHCEESLN